MTHFILYSNESDTFKDAMRELYETTYTFYWGALILDCQCQLGNYIPDISDGRRTVPYVNNPFGIQNVQGWSQITVQTAYANYSVSFDDYDDLITYLDYFGEVEEEYECSGVCDYEVVYYFSNTLNGKPYEACYVPIRDELLLGEMYDMGIGYLITGQILGIVLFIQYGLWCRKNKKKKIQPQFEQVKNDNQTE